jgi:hypothetical protein
MEALTLYAFAHDHIDRSSEHVLLAAALTSILTFEIGILSVHVTGGTAIA